MGTKHCLPPSATSLLESMRDIGYSLATAISDIIDNSIAANANEISIICDTSQDEPTLVIIDNGEGMPADQLIVAMKHGSMNPKEERKPMDLGRFGLGLKTASFSQCRQLTVVSSQQSNRVAAKWDLDLVEEEDEWIITILEENEIRQLPFVENLPETGTSVIWQKLDRIFEGQCGNQRDELVNEKLDLVEKHLALVFHRYIAGEMKGRNKISIKINEHNIAPFDPFCKKIKATRELPKEVVHLDGTKIIMQPYILPHHSRLSEAEYEYYQDRSDFLSNQGVYIYRNGRLMSWGDWFRLVPKNEATKLARVQIDFPNSLDKKWSIDIKKSKASLPNEIRTHIKQIIQKIVESSIRPYRNRGTKLFEKLKLPIWEKYAKSGTTIHYDLNRKHPLVKELERNLNQSQKFKLKTYMDSIVSSLPVEMIYADYSSDPNKVYQSEKDVECAFKRLQDLKSAIFGDREIDQELFREIVDSTRMFVDIDEEIVNEYIAGVSNEQSS